MMPEQPPQEFPQPEFPQSVVAPISPPVEPPVPAAREYRWYHKLGAVLFITFCLDIGLFLLIFPWTDSWDNFGAYVAVHAGALQPYLDNLYARGAISGIGVVNLFISLGEVFRLRRFSRP